MPHAHGYKAAGAEMARATKGLALGSAPGTRIREHIVATAARQPKGRWRTSVQSGRPRHVALHLPLACAKVQYGAGTISRWLYAGGPTRQPASVAVSCVFHVERASLNTSTFHVKRQVDRIDLERRPQPGLLKRGGQAARRLYTE